ncbi:YdcF family protein [Rubripirellula sp.]|nr:ElyC/SanA/YdcF family protein [Rubripirellula sp.]MDB4644850.1 YdcF family protein [Rubripirellula sp.]
MPTIKSLEETATPRKSRRWRNAFFCILVLWVGSSILLSTTWFRAWVSYPLHVSNMTSNCEIAYVMSDGHAYWNRLSAASDLFHMGKTQTIAIQENPTTSRYDFVRMRSPTVTQRSIRYLEHLGVPEDRIVTVSGTETPALGSWSEAQAFASEFPNATNVVVVTSSPHTSRSLLCFKRAMPTSCQVQVLADSLPEEGAELFAPIWPEYGKLAVYWFVAR